ncbi:MAG: YlbF family regulator [Longimicrobiales bacterium]
MQEILQMAERLGQSLARTDEYQSLKRAIDASGDDRELAELQSEIQKLEQEMESQLRGGTQPTEEQARQYEDVFSRLQSNASYQRLVAAQANFDKVVARVNETIHQGIQKGAESRIILT